MIGQVTPIGMTNEGWRFYILFAVCNFTNAAFFWAMLPETKQVPLEEMNKLFKESPWFVGNFTRSKHWVTEANLLTQQIEKNGIEMEGNTGMTEHRA